MVSSKLLGDAILTDLIANRDKVIRLMSHIKDYDLRAKLRKEIQELDTAIDIRVKEVLSK